MRRWTVLAVVLGAAGFLAAIAYAGVDAVADAAARIGLTGLALLVLIHLPILALLGYAWARIGGRTPGTPSWPYLWARYVRDATADVLPLSQLGGVLAGARALALTGIGALRSAGSVLADLLIEQAAKLPYVLAGVTLLLIGPHATSVRRAVYALLPGLLLVGLALLLRKRAPGLLERTARGLAHRLPSLRLGEAENARSELKKLFAMDRRTASAFAIHTLAWTLGAAETWVVFRLMGRTVSLRQAVIIDSLFCGLRTFSFAIPAALGVQEAGYVLVCALLGIPAAPAVAFSLVRRVRELALGIPGVSAWQLLEGRRALTGLSRE